MSRALATFALLATLGLNGSAYAKSDQPRSARHHTAHASSPRRNALAVPELDAAGAAAAILLIGGLILVLAGRRKSC